MPRKKKLYIVNAFMELDLVLKFHRLGRTSFRRLKEKRDYHKKRKACSWLYLSRLAATKEYAYLKALHEHKFSVPRPIDTSRHLVVMEFISGTTLCDVSHLSDVEGVYNTLMRMIIRLAQYGLIHGDFNEFNILLTKGEKPILIDLPQMISVDHSNAEYYFKRDVDCICKFFKKRFDFVSDLHPKFQEVRKKFSLDVEVAASGFTRHSAKELQLVGLSEGREAPFQYHICNQKIDEHESETGESSTSSENESELDNELIGDRLKTWIDDAREELKKLDIKDDYGVFEKEAERVDVVKKDEFGGTEEPLTVPDFVVEDKLASERKISGEENEESDCSTEIGSCISTHMKAGIQSALSNGSIITPEVVRSKVRQEYVLKKKRRLRIRRKGNNVSRQRNVNANIIKDYSGWEF